MAEDTYRSPLTAARKPGGTLRALLAGLVLAVIGGAALLGWLVWNGRLTLPGGFAANQPAVQSSPAPAVASAAEGVLLERQVAALEQRLARLDLQAAAAEGNAARAEALLVALAARRAIERGAALGYLEQQLRLRFAAARPAAVDTVIAAARQPVTLADLAAELDQLAPSLAAAEANPSAWARLRQQLADLFVVHRDAPRASAPLNRLNRAQVLIRSGQITAAVEQVSGLPGGAAAEAWVVKARRLASALDALDQIEQAALAEPEKLKTGTGEAVRQPGPAVAPQAAPPAPAPAPVKSAGAGEATF